jgi:hypothetical protein
MARAAASVAIQRQGHAADMFAIAESCHEIQWRFHKLNSLLQPHHAEHRLTCNAPVGLLEGVRTAVGSCHADW